MCRLRGTDVDQVHCHAEAWYAEANAIAYDWGDVDVADAAELPDDVMDTISAADDDPNFQTEYDEWLEHVLGGDDQALTLAIEQCSDNGVILPPDLRGTRLQTAPLELQHRLDRFLIFCPPYVAVYVMHWVYWLVRSERTRRRGNPHWHPRLPLPPTPEWMKDPPAFKPMSSWPKHWP